MDYETQKRNGPGCIIAIITAAAVAVAAAAVGVAVFLKAGADPASPAHGVLLVLKGEKDADELATEIIIERLCAEANVPPAERAALAAEMQPLARELPALSEGEKHKLAMIIREAVGDGRVTDQDLANIRGYAARSARDGDAKP